MQSAGLAAGGDPVRQVDWGAVGLDGGGQACVLGQQSLGDVQLIVDERAAPHSAMLICSG